VRRLAFVLAALALSASCGCDSQPVADLQRISRANSSAAAADRAAMKSLERAMTPAPVKAPAIPLRPLSSPAKP